MRIFDGTPANKEECDCDDKLIELLHLYRRGEVSKFFVVYEQHVGPVFLGAQVLTYETTSAWLEDVVALALRVQTKEAKTREALR